MEVRINKAEIMADLDRVNEEIDALKDRIENEGVNEEGEEIILTEDEEREIDNQIEELEERKSALTAELAEAEARDKKVAELKAGKGEVVEKFEERKEEMTNAEIRNSKEYIEAYANYIKTNDDTDCRALLTENVEGGTVPVPELVDDYIRTAWEDEQIMRLVDKSYLKGNLKVGFEISATDASIHVEGSEAPAEENLALGIKELKPQSIKKWITISDEAIDLNGRAFVEYIYDELSHKIVKKAADTLIAEILASPATSSATQPAVATLSSDINGATIAQAVALLADEARNPVVVMNKATYGAFKVAAVQANYAVDMFDGLDVVFNDTLPAYSAAEADAAYLIVGDFGTGAKANFPEGDGISFKYDDLSLAESDLVKIVGRQYVGLGVVAPNRFTTVTKPSA